MLRYTIPNLSLSLSISRGRRASRAACSSKIIYVAYCAMIIVALCMITDRATPA